ncbi:hypothetical protein [Sphingobacterium sp. SGR-19]|uniref:hypothetical protein n=1 Tax=Sphingobacterium sp. SGR-19 TaxID=2710886 RepID=UPI0013EC6986|nr:hypothetical protein [Sphingobacterium sp. SGR-19]NGM67043.1 hypothetical protein [Sphingobacterium sp. SGR-19]
MKNKSLHFLVVILHLLMTGCADKEIDFVFPEPMILSMTDETALTLVQEPGKIINVPLNVQAASGLESLVVYLGAERYDEVSYTNNELSATYDFKFNVAADASLGTVYDFVVTLTDKIGRSTSFPITVSVDATYTITVETVSGKEVSVIQGKINGDFHFEREKTYVVAGTLAVEDGGTLTIDAGSTVYFRTSADNAVNSRLVIARGSRIQATGTAAAPIVLTSEKVLRGENPSFDDWGGLFLFGAAPTNRGSNVVEDGFVYGGSATTESSGRLRYVRIEYAGKDDYHALNLFGVGSATGIDHVQVFQCQNNAFRIRGGRVNLRYIAAIDHGGYGLWADEGWQGKGQFWLFQTNIPATLVPRNFWNQARSLELRNHDSFYDSSPRTTFQIANVTLIGNGEGTTDGTRRGARVRRGAIGQLRNLIVAHFPSDAVRVEDLPVEVLGGEMVLDNVRAFRSATNYAQEAESVFFQSGLYDVTEDVVSGIARDNYVGSVASAFNPQELDPWFIAADYIGAVQHTNNDWTRQGVWFKNRDGSIRE